MAHNANISLPNLSIIQAFQTRLLQWYHDHGRHNLPWQGQSPYHTWLSEIMLQQTQVKTVIPYYQRWIETFPNIKALAAADEALVLRHWSGLGYYQRARNLHLCAKIIQEQHQGVFPACYSSLKRLPGIGSSTAAAIASLAFNLPHAICDGNVKRVLARVFGIEEPINHSPTVKHLEQLAQACMPASDCKNYTQAIMDMGATCCKPKNPNCECCPLTGICTAYLMQKTAVIPSKIKTKARIEKDYHYPIYFNTLGEIFLQQRPTKGIWPKLWCFPEQLTPLAEEAFLTLKHALTHQTMHLHFYPKPIRLPLDLPGRWYRLEQTKDLGLPKPIGVALVKAFLFVESALRIGHPAAHEQLRD